MTQTWDAAHEQIDYGKMNGFVKQSGTSQPMSYYPPTVLPFAYSLAKTFTVANRSFGSAPCQTYPNRRFLMAGTAYGDIATDTASLEDAPPPNGTIFDRLHAYRRSRRTTTPYNHYSSLASWETLLGLPRLADAATVTSTFGADVFTKPAG